MLVELFEQIQRLALRVESVKLAEEGRRALQAAPRLRVGALRRRDASEAEQAVGLCGAFADGGGDLQCAFVVLCRVVVVASLAGDAGEAQQAMGLACAVAEGSGDL